MIKNKENFIIYPLIILIFLLDIQILIFQYEIVENDSMILKSKLQLLSNETKLKSK
jgi:hypothetical protein